MKHKHEYKQTGIAQIPTGKWLIEPNGITPAIEMTRTCLVFICDCGDMLVKPIPEKIELPTPQKESEQ